MLITPSDLKAYSDFDVIQQRTDVKLEQDILEAEIEVKSIVGNDLSGYIPLPSEIRLAIIKTAQFFALVNSDESIVKGYKSEKIGDYSYTLSDGNTIRKPDVYHLLKPFVNSSTESDEGTARLRMRSI